MRQQYVAVITNPAAGTEREGNHFPTYSYEFAFDLAEHLFEGSGDDEGVEVRNIVGDRVYVIAPCYESGCGQTVRFVPSEESCECAHCVEVFCADHLFDTDGWGDDGSGQWVTPLDDDYCQGCISERRLPPD